MAKEQNKKTDETLTEEQLLDFLKHERNEALKRDDKGQVYLLHRMIKKMERSSGNNLNTNNL